MYIDHIPSCCAHVVFNPPSLHAQAFLLLHCVHRGRLRLFEGRLHRDACPALRVSRVTAHVSSVCGISR